MMQHNKQNGMVQHRETHYKKNKKEKNRLDNEDDDDDDDSVNIYTSTLCILNKAWVNFKFVQLCICVLFTPFI